MTSPLLEQLARQAQNAAEMAKETADQAHTLAQQALEISQGSVAFQSMPPFVFELAVFVLAIFVGYFVVWSVTPALHTPLMSVTNAISSVIVVGALLATSSVFISAASTAFGFSALVLASVNIFGGFLVTHRMLAMYKKKGSASR